MPEACVIKRDHEGGRAGDGRGRVPAEQGSSSVDGYFDLPAQIDEIVAQAKAEGSLPIALKGLNSIRQTLDSLSRLSGFDQQGPHINVAVQTNVTVEIRAIAKRLIKEFDHEPDLKARIARALLEIDHDHVS